MKTVLLLLSTTVAALHASESAWGLSQVTLNKETFISPSGFIERGVYGYLCCSVLTPARYMRKRLKEKDVLYQGKPLAQHPRADDILSAFVKKHDLSVCPFKSKKELHQNQSDATSACLDATCSPGFCAIISVAALLGLCTGSIMGGSDCAFGLGLSSCAGFGAPYVLAADDAFVLMQQGLVRDELDAAKRK